LTRPSLTSIIKGMYKIYLIVFLFISFLSNSYIPGTQAFADETAEVLNETPESSPAPASLLPSDKKFIKGIEVKGNKTITTSAILFKIKSRVDQEYSQHVISDDLKRLYNTGYFSDVSVDREEFQDGFKVIFSVQEKPIIDKITFSRLKYIRPKALLKKMRTRKGEFLDRKTLNDDIRTIEELYTKKGLTQVSVSTETKQDDMTNKVSLHIIIKEGSRVKIKNILVQGNYYIPDKRILKIIKSRRAWLFNSGYLKEEVLAEDLERIKAFYEKEGYIDAAARFDLVKIDDSRVAVKIDVKEGKRYFVENIVFTGNTLFTSEELLAAMTEIRDGGVFSRERLSNDLSNIRVKYFDEGYIFANVKESSSMNPVSGKVELRLDVTEGSLAYVNEIRIEGNERTRDIVIRRELRLLPGEKFDGAKLRRSKQRLTNLGYFEEVNYDIADTSVPDQKDLVVQVKEAKTGSLSFGGGYSTVDQFIGFIELEQKNFDFTNWPTFTGGGQNLSLRAETGSTRNNTQLSFTEPWLFDHPISAGFDAYRSERDRESDVGYAYDEKRIGGDVRFGKQFTEYVSGNISYKREKITIDNFADGVSSDLLAEEGENTISSIGVMVAQDKRDNVFSPSRGLYLSQAVDVAGGILGGTKDFYRFTSRVSYYVPLKFNSVLEWRLRAGMVEAYGDSGGVPIFERFYAGGARTIRGYDERKVGPIDTVTDDPIGGQSMLVGNVEYLFPLVDFLKLAVFYDIGNVWPKVKDFASGGFKAGAGMGLRVKTPVGPINLDYGYPLNSEAGEEERSGKFYFSVSRGF